MKIRKFFVRTLIAGILFFAFFRTQQADVWAEDSDISAADSSDSLETASGRDTDVDMEGVKTGTGHAGKTIEISFTVSGTENIERKYEVSSIEKVWINTEAEQFPFTSSYDVYKVSSGNSKSLPCAYRLKLKDDLESGYYKIYFYVQYRRRGTSGTTKTYALDYIVKKTVTIKVVGEEKVSEKVESENDDISIVMNNFPKGYYGKRCTIDFLVQSKKYEICSVVPVMDGKSPFQSSSQAYRIFTGKGKQLACRYDLLVKEDIKTGYYTMNIEVRYEKEEKEVRLTKGIQVYLVGKKKEKKKRETKEADMSVPRIIVLERNVNQERVYPGDSFLLTLKVKNTSQEILRNIKYTISSKEGEFIPEDGIHSCFVEEIPVGGLAQLRFALQTNMELKAGAYQVCLFAEYEDEKAGGYEATDYISIPVTVRDKLTITDVHVPEKLTVGTDGDVTFSVNNVGENAVRNVRAQLSSEDTDSEKTFVGKVSAGGSGYVDIHVKGLKETSESGKKNAWIKVTYLNSSGEKKSFKKQIRLTVAEEVPEDMAAITETEEETGKSAVPRQVIILFCICICLGAGGLYYRKRMDKK